MKNPAHEDLFAPDVSPRRRISVGDCHMLATCPAGSGPGVADATKSAVGLQPSGIENKRLSHIHLVTYPAGGSSTSSPRGLVVGSDVLGTVNSAAAQAIVAAIGKWPSSAGSASAIVDTLGGAAGDMDPAGSAFPWRKQIRRCAVVGRDNRADLDRRSMVSAAPQAVQPYSVDPNRIMFPGLNF